ncbi:sulfite exporter TauE/SafE family protein [Duganella sp. FT135W]|uniref:Sulfite exporter TauE/SafE family protein n=1 Tax=Duganella flavida TaxID=2692175 RepID=A0A6L8K6I4_9BURK|nr:sulfite exporter TauE/SafE family protein [Duganella flavida]MYM22860.1 sulfite exporter TauE/SafE family protein [Duganella flavida]
MNGAQLLPVFVVGLAGSIHCAGMCGGIVTALSTTARPHVLAYNAGRIGSYMLAGALAGGLAGGARSMASMAGVQLSFYWLANAMLIALGLYLMNAWRGLAVLEQGGRALWRHIAPAAKTFMPADTAAKAFALGTLWGWLPCGMVYSALATALLSGSAADGAAMMLAFGLGTLPMLIALGLLGARLQQAMQRRSVRIACGLLVLGFGVLGLARAAGGITPDWMDMLCLTPHQ